MFVSTLSQRLHLTLSLLMIPQIQGTVTTPPRVLAQLDRPIRLSCNVSLARGESLKQVRWMDSRNITVLNYTPRQAPNVEDPQHVALTSATRNSSTITVKHVGPQDEGCYTCLFDVYPSGTQEGQVCLSVTAEVSPAGNQTAVSGKRATLSCRYGLPRRVQQVLWSKTDGDKHDVASYAKRGQPSVHNSVLGRFYISRTLDQSELYISPVQTEDEGCYSCQFHAYPEGSKSALTCLTVYVLPKPQVSHRSTSSGVIEANCSAVARPAAEIVWNVEGDSSTLGPPTISSIRQSDGTTLVTSTLSLHTALLRERSIKCLVHHRGLASAISVSMNTKIGTALTILISVVSVAAMLLICLCVCLWKCFMQKDDSSEDQDKVRSTVSSES